MYCSNSPEKIINDHQHLRIGLAYIIFDETVLTVCTLSSSGKEIARNTFYQMQIQITRMYKCQRGSFHK